MNDTAKTTPVTFRCASEVVDSIDSQAKMTSQTRTDVVVDLILGSIPNVKVIERSKLPSAPGIYIVFTPDKKLLYLGKADNLQVRWNSHHKYQYFIESSLDSRIGYFTLDSVEQFNELVEDFQGESTATPNENVLVTQGQLNEIKSELYGLKRQFDITFGSLSAMGLENLMKRFDALKPPKGKQSWTPTHEDRNDGIVRSNLMKQFGFSTTQDLESAASFYAKEPDQYLEELSGWQCRPIEAGSTRTRFYPPRIPSSSATSSNPSTKQ